MGFGNVGLLIGMALGVVPVVIHLINRRRARLRRFAAIEFLLLSDKRIARRLKLKQILVLALRVLLVLALAFALAKPYLEPESTAGPQVAEPGAVAILIDDSASMQAVDEDGDKRIERALAEARALIESGGPRTSFAVVAMGAPARLLTPGLTYDHQVATRALEQIDAAGVTGRGADLEGAMAEAGRVLSESGERQRRIQVFSDLAAHAFKPLSAGWSWVPVTQLELPEPGPTTAPNVAVLDVRVGDPSAPRSGGEQRIEVVATVANYGDAEVAALVELKLGGAVAAEMINVEAGASREVPFNVSWAPGAAQGTVTVKPSRENRLDQDDTFYFVVGARRSVQALIVNGAPRSTEWLDELYFVRAALAATAPGETPIDAHVVQVSELTAARVDTSDVVVLANVGTLTREQSLVLEQFVERGGGVLIAAGDQWAGAEPGEILKVNDSYGRLLPFPVREVKSVGRPGDARAVLASLSISSVAFDHPIFAIFDGLEDASLFKAHVLTHVLVDTAGRPEARVLASLTGGIPALVEAPLGRGRVVLLTTTLDRDWADLALRTSFPPMLQRICAYLARTLDRPGGPGIEVGEDAHVPVPEGRGPLFLMRPDGAEVPLDANEDAAMVYVGAPEIAGHYAVMRAGERGRAMPFAVNVDRRESDLHVASEGALGEIGAQVTRDNGVLPALDAEAAESDEIGIGDQRGRTILWPWILAGLLALFASEAWLLVRGT